MGEFMIWPGSSAPTPESYGERKLVAAREEPWESDFESWADISDPQGV